MRRFLFLLALSLSILIGPVDHIEAAGTDPVSWMEPTNDISWVSSTSFTVPVNNQTADTFRQGRPVRAIRTSAGDSDWVDGFMIASYTVNPGTGKATVVVDGPGLGGVSGALRVSVLEDFVLPVAVGVGLDPEDYAPGWFAFDPTNPDNLSACTGALGARAWTTVEGVDATALHSGDAAGGQLGGTFPNPTVDDGADGTALHTGDTGAALTYLDQDVTSGSSPTFDGSNFTGLSSALVDFIATDFSAAHDFTDGLAYEGWTLTGYHANDTWETDGAGNLNIVVDGADDLGERAFIKAVTLPAPPTALTGISWNANIDFTYGAGTSVSTADSRTTWLLRSIDLAEYVYFMWRYTAGAENKLVVRNLGTDGGDTSNGVNTNWAADAAERVTIWWSPNGCGVIANTAGVSDADTWDFAVRKAWTEPSATLNLQILVDPDHANDNVNMQISRMTLAY